MITYICPNCGDQKCETSICPHCKKQAKILETSIFYCDNCNIPLYDDVCPICKNAARRVGSDLRPVFPEERLLIEIIEDAPFKYRGASVWDTGSGNYIIDGKKKKLAYGQIIKNIDPKHIKEELKKYESDNYEECKNFLTSDIIKKFVLANKSRFNYISNEAMNYIRSYKDSYSIDEMFVSFSGGKDSAVTSSLVLSAFNGEPIIHIYGDTTIEINDTASYIKEFREVYPKVPFLIAKNKEQNFYDLCDALGPPSRMLRWCCTFFKTGAIIQKIERTFKNKKKILSFQGLRRSESLSRSEYDRESKNTKIGIQRTASPIIDWLEFDVWLYILSKQIPFNAAYRKGYKRVGCYLCPNNSDWPMYLTKIYMSEEYDKFHNMLVSYAKEIKKEDPYEYVDSGAWKKRQGGNGLEKSKSAIIDYKPCAMEERTFNFTLTRELTNDFYEFFKPFGIINRELGNAKLNEVFVLDRNTKEPLLRIVGKIGQNEIKIKIIKWNNVFKNEKVSNSLIKKQIMKYQTCMGCMACEGTCKYGALKIKIVDDIDTKSKKYDYKIDENKCVGCLSCVNHFSQGCSLKRVLKVREDYEF